MTARIRLRTGTTARLVAAVTCALAATWPTSAKNVWRWRRMIGLGAVGPSGPLVGFDFAEGPPILGRCAKGPDRGIRGIAGTGVRARANDV